MLVDNDSLVQRLHELGHSSAQVVASSTTKMREITDPLSWVFCFLSLLAVKSDHELTKQLAAYAQIVIQLAWKHGGMGWKSYDSRFRKQMAAGVPLEWTKVEPSIMSTSVLNPVSGEGLCSLCWEADHKMADCALASLDPSQKGGARPYRPNPRSHPYRSSDREGTEVCRKYNGGRCFNASCKYTHSCSRCSPDHPAVDCPGKPNSQSAHPFKTFKEGAQRNPS